MGVTEKIFEYISVTMDLMLYSSQNAMTEM